MRYLSNRWTTEFFPLRSVQYVLAFAAQNEWTSSECVCFYLSLSLAQSDVSIRSFVRLSFCSFFCQCFVHFFVLFPCGLNEFPICSVWRIYHVRIAPCAWETYTHLVTRVTFQIAVRQTLCRFICMYELYSTIFVLNFRSFAAQDMLRPIGKHHNSLVHLEFISYRH